MDHSLDEIIAAAAGGARLYADEALVLADTSAEDLIPLTAAAASLRDAHWGIRSLTAVRCLFPLPTCVATSVITARLQSLPRRVRRSL